MKKLIFIAFLLSAACSKNDMNMPPQVDRTTDHSAKIVSEKNLNANGCYMQKQKDESILLNCEEAADIVTEFNQRMSLHQFKVMVAKTLESDDTVVQEKIGNPLTIRSLHRKWRAVQERNWDVMSFSSLSGFTKTASATSKRTFEALLDVTQLTGLYVSYGTSGWKFDCSLCDKGNAAAGLKRLDTLEKSLGLNIEKSSDLATANEAITKARNELGEK